VRQSWCERQLLQEGLARRFDDRVAARYLMLGSGRAGRLPTESPEDTE
jgi:hypothetical protein